MRKIVFILICLLVKFNIVAQDNIIRPFKILKGHPYKIMYLDFSSDGNYLASCGWDNTIRIWDMINFCEINILKGHSDVVWDAVLSSDNKFIASGSQDASCSLWDFKSGKLIHIFNEFPKKAYMYPELELQVSEMPNSVSGLAFFKNNTLLAAGSFEGKIRIFDLDSFKLKHTLSGHHPFIITILLNSTNDLMISSSQGKEIIIWNTETFEPKYIIKDENANTLQLIKKEQYLLSAGGCAINIYDISNGNKVRSFPVQCGLQNAQLTLDGKYLATCGEDHTARIYNFETGKEIWCYNNPKPEVGYCCISPNDKYFVVGIPEGDILIWKMDELIKNK